ncbi:hypothetical protein BRADI_4g14963v3 [Brachypodium distachyon]|uniref:Reverse transcriptase zinc-binding domain-containing protein n=1 Tax=Brachypodium distachyon TaxID=15368 RepID=A0A2K2CMX6_BRADI|nr:hypothetical protein BRADI_4g14963v3 [Brachypodium distachyon]
MQILRVRHGLDHPNACPFCDQDPETSNHLFVGCSLTRQIWFELLYGWDCEDWMPGHDDALIDWWSDRPAAGKDRKSLVTSVTLILWSIWKHRNKVVFDKEPPCLSKLLLSLREEGELLTNYCCSGATTCSCWTQG